jgi:hypothetical protein
MSTFTPIKNNTKSTTKPTIDDEKIEALWVMSHVSVVKDYITKKIVAYNCYCDACKKKSSSGNGGIAFYTAEDLLEHRNMTAHMSPCNCRFHVCDQRFSIMSHLEAFHSEVLIELENEDGFDPKKSWIIPDYENNTYKPKKHDSKNNTYTLKKSTYNTSINTNIMEDKSPLELGARMLSMKPPTRVPDHLIPPSPVNSSPTLFRSESPVPFKKDFSSVKSWGNIIKPKTTSLADVMNEQKNDVLVEDENENYESEIHYAQEDMRKEKQCPYGIHCIKKDRPFACAYNHDDMGDIIKKGTVLIDSILCPDERPPYFRCGSTFCTKIHLEHRVDFIDKMKKPYYEHKQIQGQSTNHENNMNNNSNDKIESSVVSVNQNGINVSVDEKTSIGISQALSQMEINAVDTGVGDWIDVKPKRTIRKQKVDDNVSIEA